MEEIRERAQAEGLGATLLGTDQEKGQRPKTLLDSHQWKKLDKLTRKTIVLFFGLHYFLLMVSIGMILYKRLREHDEINMIEAFGDRSTRLVFYRIFGLVYARYNLEVLNFIHFVLFARDLQPSAVKVLSESALVLLGASKIGLSATVDTRDPRAADLLSLPQLFGELALLGLHLLILALYLLLCNQMKNESFSEPYNAVVLGKKRTIIL